MDSQGSDREEMLECLEGTTRTKNFQLRVEIYQWQVPANESSQDLQLKRADRLALGGRLGEALEGYQLASQQGKLTPQLLDSLVGCLAESISRSQGLETTQGGSRLQPSQTLGVLACAKCSGMLFEPVTLSCGHSFCKKCLERERDASHKPALCKLCQQQLEGDGEEGGRGGEGGEEEEEEEEDEDEEEGEEEEGGGGEEKRGEEGGEKKGKGKELQKLQQLRRGEVAQMDVYKTNVAVTSLLGKWFPSETQALRLRYEGNTLYKSKQLRAALDKYNQAIALAPEDHLLYSNRARINATLKRFEDALRDGDAACRLQPLWLKGHLRKAQALAGLRRMDEALNEYLLCVALDAECKIARAEAQKILCDLFSPIPKYMHKRLPDALAPRDRIKGTFLNSLSSGSLFERPHKANSENPDCGITQEELKSHLYSNLTKIALALNDKDLCLNNEKTLKGSPPEKNLNVSATTNILKRKTSFFKEDIPGTTESLSKYFKRDAGSQGTRKEHRIFSQFVDPSDLECALCMRLFYEPITTHCGHTFCLKCLERSLDHSLKCPLCKEVLPEHLALRRYNRTVLIEELMAHYLPEELAERKIVYEEEVAELSRLAEYGCMLEIKRAELYPDGSSVVETVGRHRFKVLQHGQRDGYCTADIEYLADQKVAGEERAELLRLHNLVYDQGYTWFNSLKPVLKTRIVSHFGSMPGKDADPQASPNGPAWCWWLLAVFPLENRAQLPFLAMTSLQERLTNIRRVLIFISRNRCR